MPLRPGLLILCSTPFGDIDECTERESVGDPYLYVCSTPFGDIDECTQLRGASSA